MRTQVASSGLAPSDPPMWGMATFAMEVSSASMKVARVTVMAMAQGLARGRQVSWNVVVAAAATPHPFGFEDASLCRREQQSNQGDC